MKTKLEKIASSTTSADLYWLVMGWHDRKEALTEQETRAAQERKAELLRKEK